MSQDGFPNEDGEQMTPELLLLQERQRASEWPKVPVSYLHMQSPGTGAVLSQGTRDGVATFVLLCLALPRFL